MIYTNYTVKGKAILFPTIEVKAISREVAKQKEYKAAEITAKPDHIATPAIPAANLTTKTPIVLKPKQAPKNNIKFVI